jgi:hypothetical protein
VDTDCSYASNDTACTYACGVLVNAAAATKLQAAIANANATVCPEFTAAGCKDGPPPCAPPIAGGLAACVSGVCKAFPPAAWDSFSIVRSDTDSYGVPPTCAPGGACTLWTLTPDGKLSVVDAKGSHAVAMASSDFATVDAVLRSTTFRQESTTGWTCSAAPGGTFVSFDVARGGSGEMTGFDVSGCALAGPAGNDAKTLYDVIKAY